MAWSPVALYFLGGVNAVFQLLEGEFKVIRKKLGKEGKMECAVSIVLLKRLLVFLIITITWVFFRMSGTRASLYFIKNMLLIAPITLFDENIILIGGTAVKTVFIAVMAVIFLVIQYFRREEGKCYCVFVQQPKIIQIFLVSIMLYVVFFGFVGGSATVNTQFIYFQF